MNLNYLLVIYKYDIFDVTVLICFRLYDDVIGNYSSLLCM